MMLPAGSYVEFDAREFLAPTFAELVDAWVALAEGHVTNEEVRAAVLGLPPATTETGGPGRLSVPPSAAPPLTTADGGRPSPADTGGDYMSEAADQARVPGRARALGRRPHAGRAHHSLQHLTRVSDDGGRTFYDEEWVPGAFDQQLTAPNRVDVLANFEHQQGIAGSSPAAPSCATPTRRWRAPSACSTTRTPTRRWSSSTRAS